jgi:hypothetical protein
VRVDLQIRNVPIDLGQDPFQWGNGIASFGTIKINEPYRTPGADLCFDAQPGSSFITLCGVPSGWRVGDEVKLLSTNPAVFPDSPIVEPATFITSVNGTSIGLSRGLSFAHAAVFAHDGRLAIRPKILNVTRNVVIRSENANGTAGHVANIGDTACWDIQGGALVGLGRTTVDDLNSTSADQSHIGTNQIGKYAFHAHHVHGGGCAVERRTVDMVLIGQGRGKWGHVTHGTSDTLVVENIATGFQGAGFITEDGYEVRNSFLRNIGFANLTNFSDVSEIQAGVNFLNNKPGVEGACGWFHGIQNTFDGNECWNNTVGWNLFGFHGKSGLYPSVAGAMPDVLFAPPYTNNNPPILVDHALSVGNGFVGFETWGIEDPGRFFDEAHLPVLDNVRSINDFIGIGARQAEDVNEGWFRNPVVIQQSSLGNGAPLGYIDRYYGSRCVDITTGYVHPIKITGAYLSGCTTALWGVPNSDYLVSDSIVQGAVGVFFDIYVETPTITLPPNTAFARVTFLPYGSHPRRFVMKLYDDVLWDGTGTSPLNGGTAPPPPPPPVITFTTLPGLFQQEAIDGVPQNLFRLCPDTTGVNCQAFVKQ